jgi:enamine deaminase RidA (YjgF/YER057c/UK114 family)
MKHFPRILCLLLIVARVLTGVMADAAEIRCIEPSASSLRCVSVSGASLVHTAQVMAREGSQTEQIKTTLAKVDKAVKLNVHVAKDSATAPAVYSRLTIARHPITIYTGGLHRADSAAAAESHLSSLFSNLKQTLDASGSDGMHLVKATCYVSTDDLNKWHNAVLPDYFSPRRPPAASKAAVTGTGRAGQGITMDFIIVPGEL